MIDSCRLNDRLRRWFRLLVDVDILGLALQVNCFVTEVDLDLLESCQMVLFGH